MPTPNALTYNGYIQQIANLAVMATTTVNGVVQGVDDTFNTMIPTALNYAELRIQRDLDLVQLFENNSYTLAASSNTLSIPVTDFVTIQTIQINGLPLLPTSNEYIQNVYTSAGQTGQPQYFAVRGGDNATYGNTSTVLLFGPTADQTYPIFIRGTARLPSLYTYANQAQAGTATTFISTWLPDLLVQASMISISQLQRNFGPASNDPEMPGSYEMQYRNLLMGAQAEEARRKFAASGWTSYSQPVGATPGR